MGHHELYAVGFRQANMGESDTLLQIPTEQVWRLLQISRGVNSSPQKLRILRGREVVSHQPHKLEVAGSNPALPQPYIQDACDIKVE
jgi:hypothetical protein